MLKQKTSLNHILLLLIGVIIICSFNALLFKRISGAEHIVYNLRRLMSMSALMLTGLGVVLVPSIRNAVAETFCALPKWVKWAFGVLLAWGLVSAFLGVEPKYAFLEIGNYGLLTILGLFLGKELKEAHSYRVLFTAIFLGILLYLIYQVAQYIFIQYALAEGMKASTKVLRMYIVFTQFINPRFFAQVFIWIWPVMIYFSMLAWHKNKMLGIVMVIASAYFINLGLENHSRAIYYSMVVSAVAVTLIFRKASLSWWKFVVPTVVLAFGLNYLFFHLLMADSSIAQQSTRLAQTNLNGRQILWPFAWHQFIKPHPFFGAGPMGFASVPNAAFNAHPHNFILKTAAEMGIPAAIITVAIVLAGLWAWIKKSTKLDDQPKAMMFTAALLGSAFDAMVSGNLVMPFAQFLMPVFAGIGLSLVLEHKTVSMHKWMPWVFAVLAIAFMGMMIHGVIPDIFHLQAKVLESISYLQSCSTRCLLPPLFWFPEHVSPLMLWVR